MKLWLKCTRFGRIGLAVVIALVSLARPAAADDGADGAVLAERVVAVFHRSMSHWKYDYTKLPDRKAGVACVAWQRFDTAFPDSTIFEALGFSYSMADDSGAIHVATQGCERMRTHYKVTDCVCEVVLIGEAVAVTVPKDAGE